MANAGRNEGFDVGIVHKLPTVEDVNQFLEPGNFVRHPQQDDWGRGQVQSVIGDKITVNFEHMGKVVINGSLILLQLEILSTRP